MARDFKPESVEIGLVEVCKSFLGSVIAVISYDKKQNNVNYVRRFVTLPDGGVYLVSVLHVDGPEFNMEQYRLVAESQESTPEPISKPE